MKKYIYLVALLIFCGSLQAQGKVEQSVAFTNMLKAVELSDTGKFKAAYSKSIRESKKQSSWKKNISEARKNIKKMFGKIRYSNFSYKYNSKKGKLGVFHKGKLSFWIGVLKEDGIWKLNER